MSAIKCESLQILLYASRSAALLKMSAKAAVNFDNTLFVALRFSIAGALTTKMVSNMKLLTTFKAVKLIIAQCNVIHITCISRSL